MKHTGVAGDCILVACFVLAFAVLPLIIVWAFPGVGGDGFVCRVGMEDRLAETLDGKLEFSWSMPCKGTRRPVVSW